MKDLAKEILMNELNIPKIHGEVDIRLKNPMTGKIVKQIKGENTFQSAVLAKGLRNLGEARASIYNNRDGSSTLYMPWTDLVGGILLFKNSLSNAQYMSKGNKMQANGSYGVTNNANPPELGSWSENESSVSSSAMTLVYDWTTSQANGAGGISSVALTSRVGGYIGYGNPSMTHTSTLKSFRDGISDRYINQLSNINGAMKIQTGNVLYQFVPNLTDKEITVHKSHVAITQASIFDWVNDSYNTETIDVSSLHYDYIIGSGRYTQAMLSDGKIYFTGSNTYGDSITAGSKIYVWEYDIANGTISEIEITNSTGTTFRVYFMSVAQGMLFCYDGGGPSKTHVFKLSDDSYVGYIENTTQGGTSSNAPSQGGAFAGGLVAIPMNDRSTLRFYDPDNRTCFPTNGWMENFAAQAGVNVYYDPETDTLNNYGNYGAAVYNNPLYLATNYNLPSSVQKDATMTMQVRYTLTEA